MLDCTTCYSSLCDTKVEKDDQQTETMMVPATFTKHFVTIAANPMIRRSGGGLTDNSVSRKAKMESIHTISHGNGRF